MTDAVPLDTPAVLATISCKLAMPVLASEVLQLIDSGKSNAQSLSDVITKDQSLTVRVLELANSPFYGCARQVSTVKNAVVVLGEKILRNTVLALSVKGMHVRQGEIETNLWHEAISYAMAASFLAQRYAFLLLEEAFLAGLMSNLGEVMCNNDKPNLYQQVLALSSEKGQRGNYSTKVFPYSFAQYGAAILDYWHFPPALVASAMFADDESLGGDPSDEDFLLCRLVYLARKLCQHLGVGGYCEQKCPVVDTETYTLLALDGDKMSTLCDDFTSFYAEKSGDLLHI